MYDVRRVRGIERIGNLDGEVEQHVDAERLPSDSVPERLTFEQLHGDELPAVLLADVVNRADVRDGSAPRLPAPRA